MNRARCVAAVLSCLVLVACGGGPRGDAPPPPASNPPPPPAPVVSQVVIIQPTVLLPEVGATHQLSASILDAQGATIDTALTWTSNDAAVSVDSAGMVTARGIGSARITAVAGAVSSPAVLVIAARVAPGVHLLTDAQIVSEIEMVEPAAAPAFTNPFEVTLANVPALAIGDVVLGSEGKSLQGRVLMLEVVDANTVRVRLELVPLPQLVESLSLNESIDLTQGPAEIPAEIAELYDVVQDGVGFTFTPRPAPPGSSAAKARHIRAQAAEGTTALGPFSCEFAVGGAATGLPLALSAPPTFTLTINGNIQIVATPENGIETIKLTAAPVLEAQTQLGIVSAFSGNAVCKAELVRKPVRAPGWLGLLIGGSYAFGAGFELTGSVNIASASIGVAARATANVSAGFVCAAGGACSFEGDVNNPDVTATPTFVTPSLNQVRVAPALTAFGFVSADLGNPFIRQLQFKAIETRVGARLSGNFTLDALQIDDSAYRSNYKLDAVMKASVGTGALDFLRVLGLADADLALFEVAIELGKSPVGVVTADRPFYITGDEGEALVVLEPASVNFTDVGPYNVDEVLLVRRTGLTTEVLARVPANPGQTEFTLPFTAPASLAVGEFHAFVVTRLLPFDLLKLEIGPATGPPDRLDAAGGTFNDGAVSLQTAVLLKIRGTNGAPPASNVPVTITGPAGWNDDAPSVVIYPANESRQFFFLPAAAVSGAYRATALIDGASAERAFAVDATQQLERPDATIDFSSAGVDGVNAEWDPVVGAASYLARVFDTTAQVVVPEVDITVETSSHLAAVLAGDHANEVQVLAFNHDMRDPATNLPAQFNVSRRTLPITMQLTLTPAAVLSSPGAATQFTAELTGLANTSVLWSAEQGSITQSGAHIASAQAGSDYLVTATSVANASLVTSARVAISNNGCYPLSGSITKTENTPDGSSTVQASVTLQFCNSGRSASVGAISGTLQGTSTIGETTEVFACELGLEFPSTENPSQLHRSRFSDQNEDANGLIISGRLFGAFQGVVTRTTAGNSETLPVASVVSLGLGTTLIEEGRVVAVDFNTVSSDGQIVITGILTAPP